LQKHLPKNQKGAKRKDDRRIISGIMHAHVDRGAVKLLTRTGRAPTIPPRAQNRRLPLAVHGGAATLSPIPLAGTASPSMV
jgi:hypothetical protein